MPKNEKVRAYKVTSRELYSEGAAVIVFARNAREARMHHGLDDVSYIEASAKRVPQYDEFAGKGVPIRRLLQDGWYWECSHCQTPRFLDEYPIVVEEDEVVFCNITCFSGWAHYPGHEKSLALYEELQDALDSAKELYPKAEVQGFDGTSLVLKNPENAYQFKVWF